MDQLQKRNAGHGMVNGRPKAVTGLFVVVLAPPFFLFLPSNPTDLSFSLAAASSLALELAGESNLARFLPQDPLRFVNARRTSEY
jgi:hypothetical protein